MIKLLTFGEAQRARTQGEGLRAVTVRIDGASKPNSFQSQIYELKTTNSQCQGNGGHGTRRAKESKDGLKGLGDSIAVPQGQGRRKYENKRKRVPRSVPNDSTTAAKVAEVVVAKAYRRGHLILFLREE